MRTRRRMRVVLATAAVALGVSMAGAGGATAATTWTDFGSSTGIHPATYTYDGVTEYTSMMSRSGSGIVEQWLTPDVVGGHGAYYQFKPLTYGAWTTPFKRSSSPLGLTYGGTLWTYDASKYTPTGAISEYFPLDGQQYWLSGYALSNYATADFTYTVPAYQPELVRHVTFDVQMAAPGFPATGTMTYDDATGPASQLTMDVTGVRVDSTTVYFSGPWGGSGTWLLAKATNTGGVLTWAADVVATDPSATLGTVQPLTVGADVTGTITVYTR